jgi:electron transfer flavoprotein alpha subunit
MPVTSRAPQTVQQRGTLSSPSATATTRKPRHDVAIATSVRETASKRAAKRSTITICSACAEVETSTNALPVAEPAWTPERSASPTSERMTPAQTSIRTRVPEEREPEERRQDDIETRDEPGARNRRPLEPGRLHADAEGPERPDHRASGNA